MTILTFMGHKEIDQLHQSGHYANLKNLKLTTSSLNRFNNIDMIQVVL